MPVAKAPPTIKTMPLITNAIAGFHTMPSAISPNATSMIAPAAILFMAIPLLDREVKHQPVDVSST
jgi:hypothetical protein